MKSDPVSLLRLAAATALATAMALPATAAKRDTAENAASTGKSDVETLIAGWPKASRDVAKKTIDKYGPPNGVDEKHLVWNNNGPWKYTIVHREPAAHNFPVKHEDMLEQGINFRAPPDKYTELARYDGSVYPRRTVGEIAAMCDKEEMNFLALNLANDIVTGKTGVQEARETYGKIAMAFKKGEKHPYTQGLSFEPEKVAQGDPDHPLSQSVAAR